MAQAPSRSALLRTLRESANRFDAESSQRKREALQRLMALPLAADAALADYHDTLLFIAAHPPDEAVRGMVERELRRLAVWLKARRGRHLAAWADRGMPWVDTVTRFTHDCVRWLLGHPHCKVVPDRYDEPLLDLNAVLKLTLPTLERNETTASLDNDALLDALKVKPARRLAFIVGELARLDAQPFVKDQLFDALDLYVRVQPTSAAFSKAGNRLPVARVFFQPDLLRRFDPMALMNQPLPPPRRLGADARAELVRVLRNTMALTSRETDPATYLDARALRVYALERGLAVALFGMTPERQLPLESYVGFTLFKNGLPVAYGGAWVMGERAAFGMNIFEPFRGGESGFMMCQVLRAYRQAFKVRYFEVDAHQFGLDNPDGIASGAFWFYYRHGFRPLSAPLQRLALQEKKRIDARPGYHSPDKTLLRFTESNVALNFGGAVPPHLFDVTTRVTRMIASAYGGDRAAAERDGVARLGQLVRLPRRLNDDERRVLTEVALIAQALPVRDAAGLDLLVRMVRAKPKDLWAYQGLLLAFFSQPRVRHGAV
ncbi:MAG: hypothetical protein H6927_04650 [Burkholderiaceae bacterium]|nr:hypothetical protein [Pseudomonadota bacterium]MBS0596899.1 hypothetical protein [Pseudomonadota bacterium]MCO5116219.1 hypothetical protein [Burkholderiaceae bacterium]MCP5217382.1 hypothetical protein [Burkholderiaceae bacterium]